MNRLLLVVLLPLAIHASSPSSPRSPFSLLKKNSVSNRQSRQVDVIVTSNSVSVETKVNGTDSENNVNKPSWWPLWYGKSAQPQNNETATADSSERPEGGKKEKTKKEKKDEKKSKESTEDLVKGNETQTDLDQNETDTLDTSPAQNDTKSDARQSSSAAPSPEWPSRPGQVIVVGGPPGSMVLGGMSPGRSTPPHLVRQQQQQMRNAAVVGEVVATMIPLVFKFWVIVWGTRYMANRQEMIHPVQHFVFERLNDRYIRDSLALQTALDEPPMGVSNARWNRIMGKRRPTNGLYSMFYRPKLDTTFVKTVLVIEYGNDSEGGLDLKYLSDIVSFILSQHQSHAFGSVPLQEEGSKAVTFKPVDLEVVFKINSPGGSVATFGLAAAQIERLRRAPGITTTVCVDKCAASGGYMMASQANKLVAAPFAIVGSVGVIMETFNIHDLLKQYGVQPLVLKAGEAKNPITFLGKVSKDDLELEQQQLVKVHQEFQGLTIRGRPQLKGRKDDVFNGSVFFGQEALELNLIDSIMTSDEYLMQRIQAGDRVLKIHRSHQSRLPRHLRFVSPIDILPHLKSRVEDWLSNPESARNLAQAGGLIAFILHVVFKNLE